MNKTRTDKTIATLERTYAAALKREHQVVGALGEKATRAQLDKAWAVVEETNAALRKLQAAREAA